MDDRDVQFFCLVCVCTYCPQVAKYSPYPYLTNGSTTCPIRQQQQPNHDAALGMLLEEKEELLQAWHVVLLVVAVVLLALLVVAGWVWKRYWWDLVVLKRKLESKGIRGPPFRFLVGNLGQMSAMARKAQQSKSSGEGISHDIVPRVLPYYTEWSKLYGKPFLMFVGPQPTLVTSDPALLQEVLAAKPGHVRSGSWLYRTYVSMTLGGEAGLVLAEGEPWKAWRDKAGIVSDALDSDRVRAIVTAMVKTVKTDLFEKWESKLKNNQTAEIDVCKRVSSLATRALSDTAFSSSHRKQGNKVFKKQMELMEIENELSQRKHWMIPGVLPLRSAKQRKRRKLKAKIDSILNRIVTERLAMIHASGRSSSASCGNDLLGHILANARKDKMIEYNDNNSVEHIVGHCRNFFFAGYETCAIMLSWTLMLLGHYTEWQDRARAEIIRLCGDEAPDPAQLMDMKVLSMVLKESLRLYPPATVLSRELQRKASLQGVDVPAGVATFVLLLQLHREPAIWGDDALEFKPSRFENGLPEDLHPLGYLPFSSGKLVSVGQAYAVLEAKVVLAMLLQRYVFRLSPNYKHSPVTLALRPEHGVPLILSKRLPDYPDP